MLFLPTKDRRHDGTCRYRATIRAGERVEKLNRCVLELAVEGRGMPMYVPIVLVG